MPFSSEVSSFQREVRRNQHFVPGPNAHYRAIVSDTGQYSLVSFSGVSANAFNQRFFRERHGGINI
jgi:hypothetical protein